MTSFQKREDRLLQPQGTYSVQKHTTSKWRSLEDRESSPFGSQSCSANPSPHGSSPRHSSASNVVPSLSSAPPPFLLAVRRTPSHHPPPPLHPPPPSSTATGPPLKRVASPPQSVTRPLLPPPPPPPPHQRHTPSPADNTTTSPLSTSTPYSKPSKPTTKTPLHARASISKTPPAC